MVEKPHHTALRLSAGTAVRVRPGELVFVRVLRALGGGKWAVGVKGRVVAAESRVPLVPGQRLRALVAVQHGRTVLRLHEGRRGPVDELLRREGLPADPDVRRIVEGFLRSGLQVRSEQVQQALRLLERLRLESRRFARLAALALHKGIDLQSPGLEELLPILGYGDGHEGHGRYRGRPLPEGREELREELEESLLEGGQGDPDTPLPLFNHLSGGQQSWVVVPFHYAYGEDSHLYGTLRLLYDPPAGTSRRMVLTVRHGRAEAEGDRWGFVLDQDSGSEEALRLRIFSSRPRTDVAARRQTRQLRRNLHNLGVDTDDTIRIDEGFDGFSPAEGAPSYRSIDLER